MRNLENMLKNKAIECNKLVEYGFKKQLYIISGCNGAGKTTASYTVLPDVLECKEFVNAMK